MTCREAQQRLVDLFDRPPLADAAEVKSHLAACPDCAREYAEIQAAVGLIQPSSGVQASPDFKERVMNKVMETEAPRSRWRIFIPRLAFVAAAVLVAVLLFAPRAQSPAVSLLAQSAQAMSNLQSVHISARMRTTPNENFEFIDPAADWVPLEIWRQFGGTSKWRVEKPERVAVMDGKASLLLIRPNHAARGGRRPGFLDWLNALLDTDKVLDSELAAARAQLSSARLAEQPPHLVLTVERTAQGTFANDWLLNKSVGSSNHARIYRFDAATKRLEAMQLVLHAQGGDVSVFEITAIRYNEALDPSLFALELPPDVIWSVRPEKMAVTRPLPASPKEAARMFFDGFANRDWDRVLAVYPRTALDEKLKQEFGGLQVISIGEPFQSGLYAGWFVPYEIRFASGHVKKWNLAVRNDNSAHRWVTDGGY
jgi:outer membrane lipoprotein-sorting protein